MLGNVSAVEKQVCSLVQLLPFVIIFFRVAVYIDWAVIGRWYVQSLNAHILHLKPFHGGGRRCLNGGFKAQNLKIFSKWINC